MDNSDPSIIYDIQPDSIPYQNKISQSVIQINDNNNRPKIGQSMDQKNNINQNPFSINNNHITQSQIQPSFIYKNPGNYHYKESQFVYKENSVCESKTNLIVDNQELVNPYMKNNPQKNKYFGIAEKNETIQQKIAIAKSLIEALSSQNK